MASEIVPSGQPGIFEVIKSLSTLDQQAIIRPNNPPPGIAGFLFDLVGDEDTELTAEITDHFIEDNTAIQDQIALHPEIVTVRGLIAELVIAAPAVPRASAIPDPLPENLPMVPLLTPGAQQTQDQTKATTTLQNDSVTSSQSLFEYYKTHAGQQPNQTQQSIIFGYFYQLFRSRVLFTVETPYGIWTNMALMSVKATQDEDSRYKSDFTAVFKKIRVAQQVSVNIGQLAGRAALQRTNVSHNGTAGTAIPTDQKRSSLLFQMAHP